MSRAFELDGLVNVDVKDAVNSLKKVDKEVDNTSKTTDGFMGKMKSLGKVIAGAFVVKAIADFGKKCLSAASDVEEMENKFNVVFNGMEKEVDKWASDFSNAIGRNKNEIKTYLSDNQNLLVGMGMTREQGAEMSEQMVELAIDLASFNNLNEADAVQAMSKALMGETESAKTLGAALNDNTRAMAMEKLGYSGKFQALTEAQKMEVNYQAILMQSSDAIGDAERSAGSYANQIRRAKAKIEEFCQTIGTYLLPFATKVITSFTDMVDGVMGFITKASEGFSVFKQALDTTGEPVYAFGEMFKTIFGFELPDSALNMVDSIIAYFQQLWTMLTDIWNTVAVPIIDLIKGAFSGIKDHSGSIFTAIGDYFNAALIVIQTVWDTVGKPTMDFIMMVIGLVKDAFAERMPQITEFFKKFITDAVTLWNNHLKPCFEAIGNFITNVLAPVFKFVFQNIILPIVDAVFKTIGQLWNNVLKPIFTGIIDFLTGVFSGNWSKIWDGITGILKGIWGGIKTILWTPIEGFLKLVAPIGEAIIAPFRKAADAIGNVWSSIKSFFKLPHFSITGSLDPKTWISEGLPKLGVDWYANGGILTQPTMFGMNGNNAMVGGEAGPEAVLPIKELRGMIKDLLQIELAFNVDGREFTRQVVAPHQSEFNDYALGR